VPETSANRDLVTEFTGDPAKVSLARSAFAGIAYALWLKNGRMLFRLSLGQCPFRIVRRVHRS
jgi:hypothetical protein